MRHLLVRLRRTRFRLSLLAVFGVTGAGLLTLPGCSLCGLVSDTELPTDVIDPRVVQTADGALAMYNATLLKFADAVGGKTLEENQQDAVVTANGPSYIYVSGMFTDELQFVDDGSEGVFPVSGPAVLDSRTPPPDGDRSAQGRSRAEYQKGLFEWLSTVRIGAQDARYALRNYAPNAPAALLGHLFAVEGMTEILMAEIFCSGIPLSILNVETNFTLTRGFTSEEVYRHALALLDSAAVYAADSARIVHFINMGRGRALLALNDYAGAALAVADVPTAYSYDLRYGTTRRNAFVTSQSQVPWPATVSQQEGGTGLLYPNDPRSRVVRSNVPQALIVDLPVKYIPGGGPTGLNPGTSPVVFASGIEARLIESEAALHAGNPDWLTTLNHLRTTCASSAACATPAPAGDGGVAGLPPLTDPGSDTARVTLLFTERAYWLFLTGHRQGDMRRLVRQYRRRQDHVYPAGFWGSQNIVRYGPDVNLPVPVEEQEANPLYRGCVNRDA